MWQVILVVFLLIVLLAVVDYLNTRRKEAKGLCTTTGSSCTSPTGCSCGDVIDEK